jgi:very-short-patch-repair endonuclease/dTDP-glucose pyrophosphorylase
MKSGNIDMHYGASKLIFQRAEELRKFPTYEEEIVWGYLSGNKLGVKFRRQHPVFLYVADFYCHSLKLVIEIDGGIHNKTDVKINDAIRQTEIESFGIKVIRFTNEQVIKTPEIILQSISDTIKDLQSLNPSPPSGAVGRKAMIFAAGLGTRFKPWTDLHPKALALVNGKPLLQRNIEYLQQYNIRDVVVNVHHFPDQIISAIKENKGWGSNIIISDESSEVLETGGGLLNARKLLEGDEPFVTLNVDILTDLDLNKLLAFHRQHKPLISFGVTNRQTSRYFLFDENDRLCGWRNTKTNEEKISVIKNGLIQKAYSCVVVFQPEVFDLIKQKGKFSLTETYLDLAKDNLILGYDHSGDKLVDVGKPESIVIAEKLFS